MTKIDWREVIAGKAKVQTLDGYDVVVLGAVDGRVYGFQKRLPLCPQCWLLDNGRAVGWLESTSLRVVPPEPVRHTRWVNLYDDGTVSDGYRSRQDALLNSCGGHVETREITWTVPS